MSYTTIEGEQPANQEYRPAKIYQVSDEECEEYAELIRQEEQQERAEGLIQKIGQAYDELTRLIEQFPGVGQQVKAGIGQEQAGEAYERGKQGREAYERMRRASLALADAVPRCRWVKQDGTRCRCPQMKNDVYCFAHRQMREAHTLMLRLPAQEDANAIQIGLMQVQKALIEDRISTKKAGLLLYSMQLALQNVSQVTFGQAKDEDMLTETVSETEAWQNRFTAKDAKEINRFTAEDAKDAEEIGRSEGQKQKLFTAEDAKDAEEIVRSERQKAKAFYHRGHRGHGGNRGRAKTVYRGGRKGRRGDKPVHRRGRKGRRGDREIGKAKAKSFYHREHGGHGGNRGKAKPVYRRGRKGRKGNREIGRAKAKTYHGDTETRRSTGGC